MATSLWVRDLPWGLLLAMYLGFFLCGGLVAADQRLPLQPKRGQGHRLYGADLLAAVVRPRAAAAAEKRGLFIAADRLRAVLKGPDGVLAEQLLRGRGRGQRHGLHVLQLLLLWRLLRHALVRPLWAARTHLHACRQISRGPSSHF